MDTYKYPRTMQEAFGPYTDNRLHALPRKMDWQDTVVTVGGVIAFVVFGVLIPTGVI